MSAQTCAIPSCKARGAVQLRGRGYPPTGQPPKIEDTFWFCAHHAPIYEARGYEPVRSEEGKAA